MKHLIHKGGTKTWCGANKWAHNGSVSYLYDVTCLECLQKYKENLEDRIRRLEYTAGCVDSYMFTVEAHGAQEDALTCRLCNEGAQIITERREKVHVADETAENVIQEFTWCEHCMEHYVTPQQYSNNLKAAREKIREQNE